MDCINRGEQKIRPLITFSSASVSSSSEDSSTTYPCPGLNTFHKEVVIVFITFRSGRNEQNDACVPCFTDVTRQLDRASLRKLKIDQRDMRAFGQHQRPQVRGRVVKFRNVKVGKAFVLGKYPDEALAK